jgi:anti-sigma B factor antagonist
VPQASTVPDHSTDSDWTTPPFLCTLTAGGSSAAWVAVAGELDLRTSPQLESTLREAQLHARLVVLDAREVTFMDSSGVHVILDASQVSEWGGARLVLVPSAAVDLTLTAAGLHDRISTFDLSPTEPAPRRRSPPRGSRLAATQRVGWDSTNLDGATVAARDGA